jgi:hypothetical protein
MRQRKTMETQTQEIDWRKEVGALLYAFANFGFESNQFVDALELLQTNYDEWMFNHYGN